MTAERTNAKIYIQNGQRISDYDRRLRNSVTKRPVYNDQIVAYVDRKVTDPVLRDRIIAEIAKFPSAAGNFLFQQIDSMILKMQVKMNNEKAEILGKFKQQKVKPETTVTALDDLYKELSTQDTTQNETLENTDDFT